MPAAGSSCGRKQTLESIQILKECQGGKKAFALFQLICGKGILPKGLLLLNLAAQNGFLAPIQGQAVQCGRLDSLFKGGIWSVYTF